MSHMRSIRKIQGGRKPDSRQIPVQPARRSVSGAGSLTRQPYPFRSFRRPIVFSLAPLRIPRVDFVAVGDRETRWAHPLEALVEFVARRVARFGRRERAGGEAAVNRQRPSAGTARWPAGKRSVGHNEPAFRVDRALNLEIPAAGHVRRGNLDVLARDESPVILGTGVRMRIVRIYDGALA